MNDEGVHKTAPATPGLLNIHSRLAHSRVFHSRVVLKTKKGNYAKIH